MGVLVNIYHAGPDGIRISGYPGYMLADASNEPVLLLENLCDARAVVTADMEYTFGVGVMSVCTLEPGQCWHAPAAGLDLRGAEVSTPGLLTVGLLQIRFEAGRKGYPAGNQLIVMRRFLQDKSHRTILEALSSNVDLVPDCDGLRLLNHGQNTVRVEGIEILPGQHFDIPAEPGYRLTNKLRVEFVGQDDLLETEF